MFQFHTSVLDCNASIGTKEFNADLRATDVTLQSGKQHNSAAFNYESIFNDYFCPLVDLHVVLTITCSASCFRSERL